MGAMQSSCTRMVNIVRPARPVLNVRICGQEGAGKSSLAHYIKYGRMATTEDSMNGTFSFQVSKRIFTISIALNVSIVHFFCLEITTNVYVDAEMHWIIYGKHKMMIWISDYEISKMVSDESIVCDALIFVLDGTNKEEFQSAKENLNQQLEKTVGTPTLLVFVNKCDDPSFGNIDEIYNFFELYNIIDRHVRLFPCSASTGEGIKEAMDWLCLRFEATDEGTINRTSWFIILLLTYKYYRNALSSSFH
ncbi:ADP-ribosylation factor, arf, putative [Theileria equi strain WA]|uniref:ADP-ribosylation factor, arf, putative n=1 Tax=Theileria equi strain WA TaxID=1537102 RepID=L1LBU6_THEEQ|nr:ADP-ribosylation factor, arf, putative [Theileria equi strain WA]EKX72912.1 ADP-ribosylation factor, arf, putative [Theileria equi strain WA]|eukprot:XP_004832364.1 ADP-ribosylation factor, arf, putative [Theileria equi strain WA]